MSTDWNLQEIAATLDAMSLTLEELKDKVVVPEQLQQVQSEVSSI